MTSTINNFKTKLKDLAQILHVFLNKKNNNNKKMCVVMQPNLTKHIIKKLFKQNIMRNRPKYLQASFLPTAKITGHNI